MKKKVLVVDDEPDFVDFLSIRLKSSGYDVISALNGESGLKKA
jgi:two-component system alkaline phosphatase synthesis response regulator PhoP